MNGALRKSAAVVGTFAALLVVSAGAAADPEDELKSVAVLNFLRYASWPATTDGAVTVGIVGRPALVKALGNTLEGKSVNNRLLRLIEVTANTDPRCCQLIYVATPKNAEMRRVLANTHGCHVLTVGESDGFVEAGGAVNLFFVDGHIGFEASMEALDRAGITVSSNLLRLGQIRGLTKMRQAP